MQAVFNAFIHDTKVHIALLLVLLDFIFGVGAAFKLGIFRMSYVMDFMKNDILFKLVPYFALFAAAEFAGNEDMVIPGLDLGLIAGAAYAGLLAAWVGSILNSLAELRLPSGNQTALEAVAGDEKDPNGVATVMRPVV